MSDNKHKIRFLDGVLYDPFYPSGPAPSPEVIGHGLAHLCRYSGQIKRFYSVGEHSIWIALNLACGGSDNDQFKDAANSLAAGISDGIFDVCPLERAPAALLGLVHDASEAAGLVDVPSPIGSRPEMVEYKAAHDRCMTWLCDAWGVQHSSYLHDQVKEIDTSILGAEFAIRPVGVDERGGNGEQLPLWPNLDLEVQHDLSMLSLRYVRKAWVAAYNALKRKTA